ncbi:Ribonuclease 3 [Polystyrenella longa]|uniref:Ribonuclease 3 n=2 Tax=Polystyrenella longa TaxID=2528007 RepID=A0A518CRV2_9PLAN|nr:Ribonuclease 3 [Polystyrenella longa]
MEQCEQILDYQFKDRELLERCLTHTSVAKTRLDSNERLEFLGDAILGLVVCQALFDQFPTQLEGELTRFKSVLVSRNTCTLICERTGIDDLIQVGKGLSQQESIPPSVKAGVIESLIAGLYLDSGMEVARKFIMSELQVEIEKVAVLEQSHNYKSVLQQRVQKSMGETPVYKVTGEQGPDHAKCFKISAVIGSRVFEPAWGNSKKQAEQKAAAKAIEELDQEDEAQGHA